MNRFGIAAFLLLLTAIVSATGAAELVDKIDWPKFLARQDLTYSRLPDAWENGAFTGNGLLGVMFYSNKAGNELVLHVGRSDVMDHDANGHEVCRLPIGEFVITPVGKITGGTARLDLWNAEITATIKTDRGQIDLRTFTHAKQIVQVVNLRTSGEEGGCKIDFRPAEAVNPRNTARKEPVPEDQKNPAASSSGREDLPVVLQKLRRGGGYATAWTERRTGDAERTICLSVGYAPREGGDPVNDATNAANAAAREGVASLESSHRDWWHNFYPGGFISVPDARMESFYWMQLYKLASATRADRPAVDLMGPWFRHTPWPKIWWNLNLQLTYYPVYTGNRLELGESLCRMIDKGAANLAKNAKDFSSDSETVARTTGYDCWGPGGNELCNYPWALHNYYMQYRYSMDDAMLRDRLLPRMKAAMNFYMHNMKTGADKKLHITRGYSPEYPSQPTPNPDCNIDLALVQWLGQALIDSCTHLGISDPDLPKWQETLVNLTPYPTDEHGLRISANVGFDQSHRHYSHLLMVFPLYTMNPDEVANRKLIETSLDHWMGMPAALRGYSFTGASSICSSIGRKEDALKWLNLFVGGEGRFICQPNTMYTEAGPVIETPLSAARSLQDMLLQSWGGKLRIFPGVSDKWQDVTFDKLRGEGAFLVSASRRAGKTQWVRIESLAGQPCRVQTDIQTPVSDRYADLLSGKDGTMELPLKKGESVMLYSAEAKPDFTVEAVEKQEGQSNYYGLHDGK